MNDIANIGLSAIKRLVEYKSLAGNSGTLIDYTKAVRVEPALLIDSEIMYKTEELSEISQTLLSVYAGLYMQAVQLSEMTVAGIEVKKHLDRFNPDTALDLDSGWYKRHNDLSKPLGMEDFKDKLPSFDKARADMDTDTKQIREASNLAIGKMLNVEISGSTRGTPPVIVPISLRLMPTIVPTQVLTQVLSHDHGELSWSERWHGVRSGRLQFIRDFLLCTDLIDAYREGRMKDTDGAFKKVISRRRESQLKAVLNGRPSLAAASNMVILSGNTATAIENQLAGSFKSAGFRAKLFEPTSLMVIAVYDANWDRVNFYYRGLADFSSLNLRDLKAGNKGNGPDMMDIMKAYQMGNSPSL